MSFFAILLALLIEQVRPLGPGNPVHASLRAWVRWVVRNFDAGLHQHRALVWAVAVVLPALLTLAMHWLLMVTLGWLAAMAWSILILYATLGFRQFSHRFTEIRDALEAGDESRARELLAQWQQIDVRELSRSAILRHVIEHSVLAAHRHVFGVLAWYSILAAVGFGPAGAVFYRLSEFVTRYWPHLDRSHTQVVSPPLLEMATQAWRWVDWLPARITALGFAVVGSFEDAIENWRSYASSADPEEIQRNDGVILAATAGAANLRLGEAGEYSSSMNTAQEPVLAHLRSVVGLVWRSVVMWMVLLALLTLARLLG